jgi:hypothetical protein
MQNMANSRYNRSTRYSNIPIFNIPLDFYNNNQITEAKELLVESVEKLNLDNWTKPVRRKQSDNKSRMELDDIVGIFTYLDENLILNKLPIFVSINVDNIPSSRMEEGDLRCILSKFDKLDNKLDNLSIAVAVPRDKSLPSKGYLPSTIPQQPSTSAVPLADSSLSWAERVAGPALLPNPSSLALGASDTEGEEADMEGYSMVMSKRRRPVSSPIANTTASISKSLITKLPAIRVIGSCASSTIKAAKELTEKRIYFVSNLDKSTSNEDLKTLIESQNIKVLNIFEAKTKFTDSKAFRVCIDASGRDSFEDGSIWPASG